MVGAESAQTAAVVAVPAVAAVVAEPVVEVVPTLLRSRREFVRPVEPHQ